jgi:hypothetical protein
VSATSIVIGSGPGQTELPIGVVATGDLLRRNGSVVEGIAPSAVTAGSASAIVETGGPTTLTIGAIANTEILTRSGTTIDGVLPSAMTVGVATVATGLRETGGPTDLTIGPISASTWLGRFGTQINGITSEVLATFIKAVTDVITPVNAATKSWDTTEENLGVTYVTAQCDITLPTAAQVTNWPVGAPPRRIYKLNSTAFSVGLIAPADVAINGDTLGVDMTTIPGFDADPSATVMAPYCLVYRLAADSFYVCGAQS